METPPLDHRSFIAGLDPVARARLTDLSDGPGLVHLAGHAGLILGLGAAIAIGIPGWPLLLVPQGVLMVFLFNLQHECTHKTPFASPVLNEVVGHACGFLIVQPFLWFRYFHLAHHKHTNDPERDPELQGHPKPDTWPALIRHLSTLSYWRDKGSVLFANASGRVVGEYVPRAARVRVTTEARWMCAGYGVAFGVFLVWPTLFWVWLLPLALGFPVLRFYHLAEHGLCPQVTDMFRNSRTVLTGPVVRFVTWNMPYHAEHHALPAVPFHRLPALHRAVRDHLGVVSDTYLEFSKTYAQSITAR